jgi:TolB-like protein
MKKLFLNSMFLFSFMFMGATVSNAQESEKPSIAVIDFDSRAHAMNQQQVIQFISNELIRVGQYEVMDKYDLEYYAKKDTIKLAGCFAKACLQEVGKKLKVKKLLTGSISELGSSLAVTFRVLDVERGVFEKMSTREFLLIQGNEFPMLRIVLNEMFGLPNDQDIVNKLTKKSELDNAINNPYELRLQNDGPRMGMVFLTGYGANVLTNPEVKGGYAGGYGNVATLFQFGYQFEKQYLNEGNFQALFEFVPMISGLDQGRFIPSINFLNGIRNNMNGWEFAFGPNFSLSKYAMGYDDGNGNFVIKATTGKSLDQEAQDKGKTVIELPDSRGSTQISTGFLFALGKTFRSGKLNLPVNLFFIPSTTGLRYGISVGWNGKAREVLRD